MNTLVRIASIAGSLSLALSASVNAATLHLVPIAKQTVAASIRSCPVPFVPASITSPSPADLPPIAAEQNVTGMTTVRITLNADGRLIDRAVYVSSGNKWLDQAALQSAQFTRYSPEVRDCSTVGGDYALLVDFTQ